MRRSHRTFCPKPSKHPVHGRHGGVDGSVTRVRLWTVGPGTGWYVLWESSHVVSSLV